MIVVNASVPANTLAEFISQSKNTKLAFASPGERHDPAPDR